MSKHFLRLRKLTEKRIRSELHVSALARYLTAEVAPKGLRVKLKPATAELSPSNMRKWQQVLDNASLQLTQIILNHYEAMSHSLRQEEEVLSQELSERESDLLCSYASRKASAISLTKERKFARDNIPSHDYTPKNKVSTNDCPQSDNANKKHTLTAINFSTTDPSTAKSRSGTSSCLQLANANHNLAPLPVTSPRSTNANQILTRNVMNLSSITLSQTQLSALSKGLNFCPATGGFNEFQLFKDLDNFARNMRLREFFHDRPAAEEARRPLPSDKHWTPPTQRDNCLDMYIKAVQRDVRAAYQKQMSFRRNMTNQEKKALEELASCPEIVIKPADKGGAIVILNKTDYVKEAHRQLSEPTFYKALPSDPTKDYRQIVEGTLSSLVQNKVIEETTARSLIPLSPVAGRFYLLPKIHKENNPGRPIVSGIGTVTENLSRYVDFLIRDIPPSFPSFIKDTNDFLLDIMEIEIPNSSLLVTLDVVSLYTNIPHADGITAVSSAYEQSACDKPIDSQTLKTFLRLILELNNFEFDGVNYVQVSGTSMGTRIGPNYANIFMGLLESNFLDTQNLKPLYYKRYIDDIFMIWQHSEAELLTFIEDFNLAHPSISLSHSYSTHSVNFLDVTVTVSQGRLQTSLYRKPTDTRQYLHFHSSHVRHCKTAIPYSQAHRFRRICTNQADFDSNCQELKTALLSQKYPEQVIDDAITRANQLNRTEILRKETRNPNPQTNLVLTHSSSAPKVATILRKHYNILVQSERLKSVFPEPPRVVYRRNKNLSDFLTKSSISQPQITGCMPCNKPRCKICPQMTTTKRVASTASDYYVNIKGNFNCDSANVVYLLECTNCKQQYIGETQTSFRLRFNNHRSHAKIRPFLPLSRHVNTPGHSFEQLKVTILESGFKTHHDREVRESYLIYKFKSALLGINESYGKLTCLSLA